MQGLEKILEDIERVKEEIVNIDCGDDYNAGIKDMAMMAKQIILKRMNDGWISVEEQLPEDEQEYVLACRRDGSMDTARYSPYSNRWYVGSMCSVSFSVIAWCPLPEPYHPERSNL